jgi:hypothetical protein
MLPKEVGSLNAQEAVLSEGQLGLRLSQRREAANSGLPSHKVLAVKTHLFVFAVASAACRNDDNNSVLLH